MVACDPKRNTMKSLIVTLFFLLLIPMGAVAADEAAVARVRTVSGAVSIVRQEKAIVLRGDESVYKGDALRTGSDGSVGIIFKDDTVLSLGPKSEIVIDEFLFAPAQGKLSLVTRMIRGTAAYLSGIIARLSPQAVRFETPVATVGIRGTRFLVAVEDEQETAR